MRDARSGLLLLVPLAVLAGCDKSMPAAAQKAADDRAVAQVEAMNRAPPPLRPVTPQPLSAAFIARHAVGGASCSFVPKGESGAVALTLASRIELQIDGLPAVFAADTGSEKLPLGPRSHYVGKALSLDLAQPGAGSPIARLVISDPHNRTVYKASGTLNCPAK